MAIRNQPFASLVSRVDAGYKDGIATGYMSEGAVRAYAPVFTPVPRGKSVATGCGDERLPTEESIEFVDGMLPDDAESIDDHYSGYFGAGLGEVAVIGAAGTAMHGKNFIKNEEGLEGIMGVIFTIRGSLSTLHSDTHSEGHSAHFAFDSPNKDIGCLYNGQFGGVMHRIGGIDPASQVQVDLVRNTAANNLRHIFGETHDAGRIFAGFTAVLGEVEGGRHFSFDRTKYTERLLRGTPAVILAGRHEQPLTNGVTVNVDVHRASSPKVARELEGPKHFRNDVARVALEIIEVLKYYKISPEMFIKTSVVGIVPVRAALAEHGTGKPDPRLLPIGVYGNARQSIRFLNKAYK